MELSPLVIGENAFDLNRLLEKLRWATIPSGDSGVNSHAISAIEIAILDLLGKHLNLPVHTLLGGRFRDKIRIYVDTHAGQLLEAMDRALLPIHPKWMRGLVPTGKREKEKTPLHGRAGMPKFSEEHTPRSYGRRARQMKKEGFTAIKFDLDVPTPYTKRYMIETGALSNQEIQYLASLVASVRRAVGDDTDILFDLHWRFDVSSSLRLAHALEPYGLMWLEDPVPPENVSLLRSLTSSTKVPIATGENIYNRYGFSQLLETGINVVTPDALKAGGLTETKLVAQMAAMKEVTVSPHNIGSPVGTMAQAHLAASIPNFGVLEFHGHDVPIWHKLSKKPLIRKGFIELTDEPGLGIELDEGVVEKYSLLNAFDF